MKEKLKQLVKFYRRFDVDSKTFFGDYYFHKPLFIGWVVLMALLVVYGMISYGTGDYGYIDCFEGAGILGCENPFYNESCTEGVCSVMYVAEGETLGIEPPFLIKRFGLIVFLLGVLAFSLNHLLFNLRGKKLWIKIN